MANNSVPEELYPRPDLVIVCANCRRPLEAERMIRPGETLYKPCPDCGRAGIIRAGDLYEPSYHKKPARLLYWERPA